MQSTSSFGWDSEIRGRIIVSLRIRVRKSVWNCIWKMQRSAFISRQRQSRSKEAAICHCRQDVDGFSASAITHRELPPPLPSCSIHPRSEDGQSALSRSSIIRGFDLQKMRLKTLPKSNRNRISSDNRETFPIDTAFQAVQKSRYSRKIFGLHSATNPRTERLIHKR